MHLVHSETLTTKLLVAIDGGCLWRCPKQCMYAWQSACTLNPGTLHMQVAVDGEVLAAMSNINYARLGGMLDTWMDGVKRCGVANAMVIALDAETKAIAEKFGVPAFEMHVQVCARSAGP